MDGGESRRRGDALTRAVAAWLTAKEIQRIVAAMPKSAWATTLEELNRRHRDQLQATHDRARPHCKHEGTCTVNAARGFVHTFLMGLAGKYLVSILPSLVRGEVFKNPSLLWSLASKDQARFALFLASFSGVFKGTNCLLRHARGKEDNWNAFVAGSLAGLTMAIDDKSRRLTLALYISTRTMEFAYLYLMKRGYLPNIPHGDSLVMALSSAQIINALVMEPDTLARSYFSFLLVHGGMAKYGKLGIPYLNTLKSLALRNRVDLTPIKEIVKTHPTPFEQLNQAPVTEMLHACMHPRSSSCTVGAGQFFLSEMPNALRVYVPLNILMALIFRRNQMVSKPGTFLWRTATSSMRSSIFLATYCTVSLLVPCYMRDLLGNDYAFSYYINGFMGGLSVLLEHKSRRIELAMYCAPRALESLWNSLAKRGLVRNIANGELLYFAVAMGTLLTIFQNEPDNLNGTYRGVLDYLIGDN